MRDCTCSMYLSAEQLTSTTETTCTHMHSFKPGSTHKALLFLRTGGKIATHAPIWNQTLGLVQPKAVGPKLERRVGAGDHVFEPHLEMVACVYTNSEILQSHVPKYGRLQSSNFLPPGLIEDTGWGFKGNGWLPEVNSPKCLLSNVPHGNFSITWKYTAWSSSQLQEMMARNWEMVGGFFLYNSEHRFL